jgi:hypothetical protein
MMESNSRNTLAYGMESVTRMYKLFLDGLYNSGMKTYRIEESGDNYELRYSFIKTLSGMLEEVPEGKLKEIMCSARNAYEGSKTGVSGVRIIK